MKKVVISFGKTGITKEVDIEYARKIARLQKIIRDQRIKEEKKNA